MLPPLPFLSTLLTPHVGVFALGGFFIVQWGGGRPRLADISFWPDSKSRKSLGLSGGGSAVTCVLQKHPQHRKSGLNVLFISCYSPVSMETHWCLK